MIISFAKTTDALLAGQKSMTRRDWSPLTARRVKAGALVDAWNYSPRVNSARRGISVARKVATIRITKDPYEQWSWPLSPADFVREGFDHMWANGRGDVVAKILENWRTHPRTLWVVEFELVERVP